MLALVPLLLVVTAAATAAATAAPIVNLTIGYLPTIGGYQDKQGLSISGAVMYALEKIAESQLLPNISLVLYWEDTKSDLLHTTKVLTEMMCDNVVAVFGPENTCNVEATISSAWNRMMISHVSIHYIMLVLFSLLLIYF